MKGYIGKPDPGFTPTLLGSLLFNAQESHKKIAKSDRARASYKHRYPRDPQTFNRLLKSVEILRYKPRYSMNDIADIIGVSSRTIHNYTKKLYDLGFKAFNCMRNQLYRRSKNPSILHRLSRIFRAFINGELDILDVFSLTGWDPP